MQNFVKKFIFQERKIKNIKMMEIKSVYLKEFEIKS